MTKNLKMHIRIWISVIMITGMFLIAEVFGESEIIFPETAALTIGAWIAEKQPWKASRKQIAVLMTMSAFTGYIISAFFEIPLFFKIISGFIFCAVSLILTKCTMLPMVSACILPVLIGTESIIYPISVTVITLIIVFVQWFMEKYNIKTPSSYEPVICDKKTEISRWIFLFAVVIAASAAATICDVIFVIAPPLIVSFCEFSYTDSKARKSPVLIFLIISLCACFGTCSKLLLCNIMDLPVTLAAFIVAAAVLYFINSVNKLFPPVGALALLPFIINNDKVFLYPFEVMAGSAVFITLSMIFGKYIEKGKKNK